MVEQSLWQWLIYGWIAMEVAIAVATRTRSSQGALHDRGTQVLLWVLIFVSFFAASWLRLPGADMRFDHGALRWAGLEILIGGLALRITAIAMLGKAFSANVAIRSEQTIRRNGLYRYIRHPSYLGMEIIFFAAGLHAHNWISLGILLVLPTAGMLVRIHVEEAALLGAFGEEYADYMRTTKRLIPGVY